MAEGPLLTFGVSERPAAWRNKRTNMAMVRFHWHKSSGLPCTHTPVETAGATDVRFQCILLWPWGSASLSYVNTIFLYKAKHVICTQQAHCRTLNVSTNVTYTQCLKITQ